MALSVRFFLYVVIAYACLESTLANVEGDVNDCPLNTGRRSPLTILEELITIQARCLNESSGVDLKRLEKLNGLEEHRAFFKRLCGGRPAIRACLTAEHTKWTSCYNDTIDKLFTVVDHLFDSSLEKECVNDGENLAVIVEGFYRFTEDYRARNPFVRECIVYTYTRWAIVLRSIANIPTKIWFFYREFQKFKECFSEYIPEDFLLTVSLKHMNELLDDMKCIHPIDDNLVLCKSIDSSLIDRTSVCPLTKKDGDSPPIGSLLEKSLLSCSIKRNLANPSTHQEFIEYFTNYCRRIDRVGRCLNETLTAADLCLHDAQYTNLKLVHDTLDSTLKAGCFEEGRRFANIFYTARNLANTTDQENGFIECLSALESMKATPIGDPSRTYQLYQELVGTRRCLVDKVDGDSTYYDDVNALMDVVMAKMKCVDTHSGSIVLCQTIATN